MPSDQHLHDKPLKPGAPGPGYCWLSYPGSAALSLLLLHSLPPRGIFGGALDDITDTPRHFWLRDDTGQPIDEAMACAEDSGVLLTCHGGPAVRRALEFELARVGLQPQPGPPATGFRARTLALLPQARGAGAVSLVLQAAEQAEALRAALQQPRNIPGLLADCADARFLLEPPRVQLWGPVNAGKSSLLNALCGRSLAAVGDEPGLTRDVIEGRLEHAGFELRLFDAPGAWADARGIDAEALKLAERWRDEADLVLELVPPGAEPRMAGALPMHSQADQPGADGVSIHRPETLAALKERLVEHFFGALRRLPSGRRFALHPELRADLQNLLEGAVTATELVEPWLDSA